MKYLKSAVYKKSETVHKLLKYKIADKILMLIGFFKKKGTERKGFEPLLPSPINSLSRTAPSTARPSLHLRTNKILNLELLDNYFYYPCR